MKPKFTTYINLCLCVSLTIMAPPKVLLAQPQPDKIAQVKSGALKTAHASWWGFDKEDSTEALQNAINSGVPELIVDETGSDWVVSKTLKLASNQKILFADGVVVQAKKGYFKQRGDSLFVGRNVTNVELIAQGNATLRMQRADYDNPKLYDRGEWRHGLSFYDSKNIIIRGLTVTETGGDGLYLGASDNGYNKNILVENCNFVNNYRQGISVISAEDLIVRNCKMNYTGGTAPQAGIDFEPNKPGQRLVNCLVEDSEMIGNNGDGLLIFAGTFDSNTLPVSIKVRRCNFAKNNGVGFVSTISDTKGNVAIEDCTFDHDGIKLTLAKVNYSIKNSTLDFKEMPDADNPIWKDVPVTFALGKKLDSEVAGDINFQNTVIDTNLKSPVQMRIGGKGDFSNQIAGNLTIRNDQDTSSFDFPAFIRESKSYLQKLNELNPSVLDLSKLQPPKASAPRKDNSTFYAHSKFTFLQYAVKGQKVDFSLSGRHVYGSPTAVELYDPDGQKVNTYAIPAYEEKPIPASFTAEKTGFYRITREGSSFRIDINSANPGNGFVAGEQMSFLPVGKVKMYFAVPAGIKDFTIGVSSDSMVNATLLDPQGTVIEKHNKINTLQLFSATRENPTKTEIWAIEVDRAIWSVKLHFYEPLQPIVSTNPTTLLLPMAIKSAKE